MDWFKMIGQFLDATASLGVGMSVSKWCLLQNCEIDGLLNFGTLENLDILNLLLFQIVNFGKMTAIISDYIS